MLAACEMKPERAQLFRSNVSWAKGIHLRSNFPSLHSAFESIVFTDRNRVLLLFIRHLRCSFHSLCVCVSLVISAEDMVMVRVACCAVCYSRTEWAFIATNSQPKENMKCTTAIYNAVMHDNVSNKYLMQSLNHCSSSCAATVWERIVIGYGSSSRVDSLDCIANGLHSTM